MTKTYDGIEVKCPSCKSSQVSLMYETENMIIYCQKSGCFKVFKLPNPRKYPKTWNSKMYAREIK